MDMWKFLSVGVRLFHTAGIGDEAISALLSRFKEPEIAFSYVRHVYKSKPSLPETNQPVSAFSPCCIVL